VDALIRQLFSLSLYSEPADMSKTAHHALMLVGAAEPRQFVISLGQYMTDVGHTSHSSGSTSLGIGGFSIGNLTSSGSSNSISNNSSSNDNNNNNNNNNISSNSTSGGMNHGLNAASGKTHGISHHSASIITLGALIKQDPVSLLPLLPRVVEIVVRCLDPHFPVLRESCLNSTTKLLHAMVKKYPMVSFHQESQRLAVGTTECTIIIYDLKAATKWHLLEGHTGPISALSFAASGKMLASYSLEDCEVRFWSAQSTFLGFSAPHCILTFKVSKVTRNLSQVNLLEAVKLKWLSPSSVSLIRTWEGSITLKI